MAQYSTGGYTMTPMGPQINPNLPVYRPEIQKGLLSDTKAQDLIKNFAGGLLGGYQVNATPNQNGLLYQPTNPSGVYTAEQTGAPDSDPRTAQQGANLTFGDMMRMSGVPMMGYSPNDAGSIMQAVPSYGGAFPEGVNFNTAWTGDEQQRALLNSLLNNSYGE